jgi:hypothetical protein
LEKELGKDSVLSPIIFNWCSEYHTREAIEGVEGLEMGG